MDTNSSTLNWMVKIQMNEIEAILSCLPHGGSREEYAADLCFVMLSCNFRNITYVVQISVVSHYDSPSRK